jgi:hypothetical protein
MPKYVLTNGQRANFLKGRKTTTINGVTVEVVEDILFGEGEVVDTGDFSLQSFVDIGMISEVKNAVEMTVEDCKTIATEGDMETSVSVFVGDESVLSVEETKVEEVVVEKTEVVVEKTEEAAVESTVEETVVEETVIETAVEETVETTKRGRYARRVAK